MPPECFLQRSAIFLSHVLAMFSYAYLLILSYQVRYKERCGAAHTTRNGPGKLIRPTPTRFRLGRVRIL